MAIHQMNSSPVSLSSTPQLDIPLPPRQIQASRTNVWGLGANGMGIRSNPVQASTGYSNGQTGEVVIAINTIDREQVEVSFVTGNH